MHTHEITYMHIYIYIYMQKNVAPCDQPTKESDFVIVRAAWANVTLGIFKFNIVFRNCTCQNLAQKKKMFVFCLLPTPISESKCVSMWPAQQGIRFFMIRRTWAHVTLAIFDFNFEFSKSHIPKSGSIKKWWCFACFPPPSLKENVSPCDQPNKGKEFSMIRWPWANVALAIWHFNLFFWIPLAKIWLRK